MFKWTKSSKAMKPPIDQSRKETPIKGPKASEIVKNVEQGSQTSIGGMLDCTPSLNHAPGYPSQRLKTDEFRKPPELEKKPALSSGRQTGSSMQRSISNASSFDAEMEEALNPDNPELKEAISTAKETSDFRSLLQFFDGADTEQTRTVVAALRALTKRPDGLHRARLASVKGVEPLVSLLDSEDPLTAEHAVTTIMNLSLVDAVKGFVFESPKGISGIVNLLENGSEVAKENAAATIFLLADNLERQEKIGRSNSIPLLLELLENGSLRGKKDASLALFNLTLNPFCRKEVVRDGGVQILLEASQEQAMEEKSVAILSNLAKIPEGREEIMEKDGIATLVEILDLGSLRSKEDATSVLLLLAQHDMEVALTIDKEGARGGLIKLSSTGTPRGKKKAQELLELIRNFQQAEKVA